MVLDDPMEAFALESHTRALKAIEEGRFDREIAPLNGVEMDETPRNTSMEKMAELQPLAEGGTITAAVSSQTCDAASAMLLGQRTGEGMGALMIAFLVVVIII